MHTMMYKTYTCVWLCVLLCFYVSVLTFFFSIHFFWYTIRQSWLLSVNGIVCLLVANTYYDMNDNNDCVFLVECFLLLVVILISCLRGKLQ